MQRRSFLKAMTIPLWSWLGAHFMGCGSPGKSAAKHTAAVRLPETIRIWSYYVPLTDYAGVIEEFADRDPLDLKVDFAEASRRTGRISGQRNDGTSNRVSLNVGDLRQSAEDYLRVKFWHDDTNPNGTPGHCLHIFKRYLEVLENGEKLFVATGMIQGHFHVVMIDPSNP